MKRRRLNCAALVSAVVACVMGGALANVVAAQQTPDLPCPIGISKSPLGCIETKYDRFEDRSVSSLKGMVVSDDGVSPLYLTLVITYTGSSRPHPAEIVGMAFASFSTTGFHYTDESCDLVVLADGDRSRISTKKTGQEIIGRKFGEGRGALVSYANARKIFKSTKVEMRLCQTEFAFSEAQLRMVRLFLDRFSSPD